MTKLVDRTTSRRSHSPRGQRRREQLIDAGIVLLGAGGWPAVTTRAVAEHCGTNQGLIHYHFGGLPGLRVAIAERAGDMIVGPVVDVLLDAHDVNEAIEALGGALPATAEDDQVTALAVELIAGAMRDEALGDVFRRKLRDARGQIADRLRIVEPDVPPEQRQGAATLIAALVDGLMLHFILDSTLPADDALNTLRELNTATRRAPGEGR